LGIKKRLTERAGVKQTESQRPQILEGGGMFLDRTDAGRQLAKALAAYKEMAIVVYALPRGGVVLGVEVARFLEAPLDLIVVRKIGHPIQPEYAIGAVAEDGYVVTNPEETAVLDRRWLERATAAELKEAQRRRALFLQGRRPVPVTGKTAVIIDDGLATGLTMLAAIHEIRQRRPEKIIVAVPVAAADTVEKLRPEVDDLVVLHVPEGWFGAIGAFYRDFDQVSDEEVIALMKSVNHAAVS
jgi:putative phosphoribosyl transferase